MMNLTYSFRRSMMTISHRITTPPSIRPPPPPQPISTTPKRQRHHEALIRRRAGSGVETMTMRMDYSELSVKTYPGISIFDMTPAIRERIEKLGIDEGFVNVLSRHTTTAVTINENEKRLLDDIRAFLLQLAPPDGFYLHNDLHLREAPEGWPGGWEAWAAQEPENAHSHLLSMMLGNSETIPISDGVLKLGQWQSVLLVDLDGPRERTMGIQLKVKCLPSMFSRGNVTALMQMATTTHVPLTLARNIDGCLETCTRDATDTNLSLKIVDITGKWPERNDGLLLSTFVERDRTM